jgi:hypothetical protein
LLKAEKAATQRKEREREKKGKETEENSPAKRNAKKLTF